MHKITGGFPNLIKTKFHTMNKSLITVLMIFICQASIAQTKKITGFYDKNIDRELSLESQFDNNLSSAINCRSRSILAEAFIIFTLTVHNYAGFFL